jgi:hypothetical protein
LVGWLFRIHQSEGVFCQTHQEQAVIQNISKEATPFRPAMRPSGPRHTIAQPSSSSFLSGISTSHNPWRYTAALQPSITYPRHLPVLNTPSRGRTKVIPQCSTRNEARPTHYNQTTTQHLLYDFDINIYYIYVVLWFSLPKACSNPHRLILNFVKVYLLISVLK